MLIDLEVSAAASNVLPPNLCLASLFGLLLSSPLQRNIQTKGVCSEQEIRHSSFDDFSFHLDVTTAVDWAFKITC